MGTSVFHRVSFHRLYKSRSTSKPNDTKPAEARVVTMDQQQQPLQPTPVPDKQTVLLLHAARQPYELADDYPVPALQDDSEALVRTQAIGLNPIDWKSPDFNFAIPQLPYISGRELAGEVVVSPRGSSRLKVGDKVLAISTDYRDLRKAAYQQYAVCPDYNIVRLPRSLSVEEGSTLGVAFVAAALGLGVCIGLDFSTILGGPDLYTLVRQLPAESLAADIRQECLDNLRSHDRAQPDDWIAIWGGSSTSANLTIQLARLAGLKTISVVDTAKHGVRLSNHRAIRADLLVDSHDPQRAIEIIRRNAGGRLRFAVDTRGRDSAVALMHALDPNYVAEDPATPASAATVLEKWKAGDEDKDAARASPPSPPATPHAESLSDLTLPSAHLVGLTGLPKQSPPDGVVFHTVPIKLFHEVPAVGQALVEWLERLLEQGLVTPPDIIDVEKGLGSINKGLDRMRRGEISGGKLVVRVD
ncbi:hypothetical protein VTJ83DRAFT_6168 [Remersonia thermophila]|uniref:Enoyl reductase (ER) domain-containing protein n=1 Tax=Remersonia thermophila TaxID=72144 RepID=A0ABR4D8Y7_9PEZI